MAEVKRRRREYWSGLAALVATIALACFGVWPVPKAVADDGVLDMILDDRVLIGMIRLTLLVMALYAIASVPALIAGGRWVKGMGTSGIIADDARIESRTAAEADRRLDALQKRNDALEAIVDDLWALLEIGTAPE